jgi:hypothetical protein
MRKIILSATAFGFASMASVQAADLTFAPVTNKQTAPSWDSDRQSQSLKPEARTTTKPFLFKDASGKAISVPLVEESAKRKIIAKVDPSINPTMVRAATIAQERAHAHSKSRCWRYVKQALLAAGAVNSYPKTTLAKQAGSELVREYGFKKIAVSDPYAAPVGAVLVYGAAGAGHVEIRTRTGFASDFKNAKPSKRRLIGVYAKA